MDNAGVDEALVRDLLHEQHPDLAGLGLREVAGGWDNRMWRRFFDAYADADDATVKRARGWAVLRALHLIGIGQKWEQGLPGGKQTWGPAGWAALERALAFG